MTLFVTLLSLWLASFAVGAPSIDRSICSGGFLSAIETAENEVCGTSAASTDLPWDVLFGLERVLSEKEESPADQAAAKALAELSFPIPDLLLRRLGSSLCRFTDAELIAFTGYATLGPAFNDFLRGLPVEAQYRSFLPGAISLLDNFLKKLPISGDEYVVRGTKLPPDLLTTFEPGKQVTLLGYTSATVDGRVMKNFAGRSGGKGECWLIKQRSGRDVRSFSALHAEREVLFSSGARFNVKAHRPFDEAAARNFQQKKCDHYSNKDDWMFLTGSCQNLEEACATFLELEEVP